MSERGTMVLEALLASGAIRRGDLEATLTSNSNRPKIPNHREFLPIAEAACSRESLRTYRTTFRRLVVAFGDTPVDAISSVDLRPLALKFRLDSVDQKGGSGVGAEEGFIRRARRFYQTVKENGFRSTNPASDISFPHRSPRVHRALNGEEMEQPRCEFETSIICEGRFFFMKRAEQKERRRAQGRYSRVSKISGSRV